MQTTILTQSTKPVKHRAYQYLMCRDYTNFDEARWWVTTNIPTKPEEDLTYRDSLLHRYIYCP